MEKKLEIQSFIMSHPDWEKILTEKPYCISVQRDRMFGRNLVLFKYSQVDSDFSLPLVRECRGLILDEDTLEPVCVPFFKFFNAGEPNAAEIDWKTSFTSVKEDGSLIKVVRLGNDLLVSTNGTIDAYKAPIQDQVGFVGKTFGDLFELAVAKAKDAYDKFSLENHYAREDWLLEPMQWLRNLLSEGCTYMFELTSPYNKVVVQWHDTAIYFIGCRDNVTLQEARFFEHPLARFFHTPELFKLGTLDECREAADKMSFDEEGFVVCDSRFNRVKVKSPSYVAAHHLRGEGGLSLNRVLELIKRNERDEFLTYFPEYGDMFVKMDDAFNKKVSELENTWNEFKKVMDTLPTRKEKALWIMKNCGCPGFMFSLLDGKSDSIRSLVWNCPNEKLLKLFNFESLES